jgi:hypothetical protein
MIKTGDVNLSFAANTMGYRTALLYKKLYRGEGK